MVAMKVTNSVLMTVVGRVKRTVQKMAGLLVACWVKTSAEHLASQTVALTADLWGSMLDS